MKVYKYGDMPKPQFMRLRTGLRGVPKNPLVIPRVKSNVLLPLEVDWRKQNILTPVRDQGLCGSCWAFSSAAVLESAVLKASIGSNTSEHYSVQQLVDCAKTQYGCDGGLPDILFQEIKEKGVTLDDIYQYEGEQKSCRLQVGEEKFKIIGQKNFTSVRGTEDDLKFAVATYGPCVAAVDADFLQLYKDGVYYDARCTQNINHAIVVVGYGTTALKEDYW